MKWFEWQHKSLLNRQPKEETDSIVFASTFNPNNGSVKGIVRETFKTLQETECGKGAFGNKHLIFAKRQPPNFKRLLCKANFEKDRQYSVKRCNANCKTCQLLVEGSEFFFERAQTNFKINANFTCSTKNLLYILICECSKIYIGETGCSLKSRITTHASQIKNDHLRYIHNLSWSIFA